MYDNYYVFCMRIYMCVTVCVCVCLCVCSLCYCLDQSVSVYVCCAESPLLNCLEVEQPPSVNQAERATYPTTGSGTRQREHTDTHTPVHTCARTHTHAHKTHKHMLTS